MKIIAHRGYRLDIPENTIESFQAAIDFGVDGIETDVRIDSNGELFLFHDRYIEETQVKDMSIEEISQAVGYKIPTLNEVLEEFKDVDIIWNLEIKVRDIFYPVMNAISPYSDHNIKFMVSSFLHNDFEGKSQLSADAEFGFLMDNDPMPSVLNVIMNGMKCDTKKINHIVWYYEFISQSNIERARDAGIQNWVYSPKTLEEHLECLRMGCDAIITKNLEYKEYILNYTE